MLLHALAGRPGSPVFFAALSLLPVSSCVQFSEPLMKISFVYPFRGEPTPKTDSPIILICKSGDVDSIASLTYFVNMFNINFYTFFICFVTIPILPHKKRRKAKAYSHPCSVSKIYKSKHPSHIIYYVLHIIYYVSHITHHILYIAVCNFPQPAIFMPPSFASSLLRK